jgi:5-methylcytosine-specific restriction enzyme B
LRGDRAFTLEFWDVAVNDFPSWGSTRLTPDVEQQVRTLLHDLSTKLSSVRMHFGYRVINDVVNYMAFSLNMKRDVLSALDEVVYAKILPKLRGENSKRFAEALTGCRDILAQMQLTRSRNKVDELLSDLSETGTARFWR